MKAEVQIQIAVPGFHNYPDAPECVDFLSYQHRHTFIITCGFKVDNLNREQEIFILRNLIRLYLFSEFAIESKYGEDMLNFKAMSCEMIAHNILLQHMKKYQMIWCKVWEESTGGAKISI